MNKIILCFFACALTVLGGCKQDKVGEVSVPEVQVAGRAENSVGTALGQEEVLLVREDGEPETVLYTRVRVGEDVSIAYDPERFSMETAAAEAGSDALWLRARENPGVTVSLWMEAGGSAEELADQYVYESNEECTVEEVTIGEGEYPAIWVSYSTGNAETDQATDLYVLRYNGTLYVLRLDCPVPDYETAGEEQQMLLSTLRFDEG